MKAVYGVFAKPGRPDCSDVSSYLKPGERVSVTNGALGGDPASMQHKKLEVVYVLDGKDNLRRCNVNSSSEKSFQIGDTMSLYADPKTGAVLEHPARLGLAIFGALLIVLGILVGLSTLSVLL